MTYLYPHSTVAEPVLYHLTPDVLCCAIRTEDGNKGMALGVARAPYQDWHWHHTSQMIHPSAVLQTQYGTLLAGRELARAGIDWHTSTALWHLDGQYPRRLARLPSGHDTGYAGLCPGNEPDQVLCSYYSQHRNGGMYDTPLPGAHVFVATLMVTP
jgi:hypothetical protein